MPAKLPPPSPPTVPAGQPVSLSLRPAPTAALSLYPLDSRNLNARLACLSLCLLTFPACAPSALAPSAPTCRHVPFLCPFDSPFLVPERPPARSPSSTRLQASTCWTTARTRWPPAWACRTTTTCALASCRSRTRCLWTATPAGTCSSARARRCAGASQPSGVGQGGAGDVRAWLTARWRQPSVGTSRP